MESNNLLITFIIALFSSMNEANRLESVYYYESGNPIATVANPNINLPLKIIVHGFTEIKNASNADGYVTDMKNAILKYDYQKITVMVVNWDSGSNYDSSVINITHQAGEDLTNLLISLGISEKNIHCIGHSLGAQMCGFAGQVWLKKKGTKFARITGLDPSGPNFGILETVPVNERLDKDDATYVDIYHTNSGLWGINYNAGHSDYWINGVFGSYQPGCLTDTTAVKGFCSHKRSWAYFTASIENKNCFTKFTDVTGFINLDTKFGYWSDKIIPNIYLKTGATAPFCQ